MTLRYKLLSAATAIGMALAVGGAQAAEVITDEQLDTISAGAVSVAAGAASGAAAGGVASVQLGGGVGTSTTNFPTTPVTLFHSATLFGQGATVAVSDSGF